MKIHHIAIWTQNLEKLKTFYVKYFNGISNEKYINKDKGFESYFIRFDNDISVEIMSRTDITETTDKEFLGFCHIALDLGSKQEVLALTERLRTDGYTIYGEPRTSGDNYFESVVLDTDGNKIELVTTNI